MRHVEVNYTAPPTLSEFLDSNAFVRVIMGPLGAGKSSACVLEILRRAQEQAPGPDGLRHTRFAVVRNTYGQLRDTTRKTFEQWVPERLGKWNEQEFAFRMEFADVRCEVLFRALDRPQDVGKLLSLELTGCYFNELREISRTIFDGMGGRVGRYPAKMDGGATWFGIWGDTNPWHATHWGHKLFAQGPKDHALFRQPSGMDPLAENVDNLPAGYYQRLCEGKDSEWVKVYVHGQEAASDVGSVYGELLDGLELRGGLREFDHPTDGIFTSWDLGFTDSTAIWFWRVGDAGIDFVGHYKASGKPLSHYFELLEGTAEDMGWTFAKHWLPHDAAQKTLATGTSILNQFHTHFGAGKVAIGPSLTLLDGIQAGRFVLERPNTRFHPRCSDGIEDLREYRYEWDEEARTFSRRPLHNFASHTADAFRYASAMVKVSEVLTRKPKPPSRIIVPPRQPTLDDLWKGQRSSSQWGRI